MYAVTWDKYIPLRQEVGFDGYVGNHTRKFQLLVMGLTVPVLVPVPVLLAARTGTVHSTFFERHPFLRSYLFSLHTLFFVFLSLVFIIWTVGKKDLSPKVFFSFLKINIGIISKKGST